ncbi:MAG TPA: ATP-binding cassette domain-containing protein [Methylomusa anaerophila]|uniref:Spermidine/putrescine import ATP-binding protein PotA n=1 Tax=Methylomusa anaerophila TaxID=1930071 RepID=A0A348ALE7_9FIRM|nr:ATP-binding cassette domain-containing protein [Methylomusa anaerophila]BBB91895.1 spermidine/putrescine import ATP-binding protein PotA [Methylomusa anaerophila]HML88374.1 ATP-binding cassette domain-containing protein [Methylomusa anaerophila]
MRDRMLSLTVGELLVEYPYAADFFQTLPVRAEPSDLLANFFAAIEDEVLATMGMERRSLVDQFITFMSQMEQLKTQDEKVNSITIMGGIDKDGNGENVLLTINAGEIICIVGPTGSGKSRLLADIEWVAQRDTPTNRKILVNGQVPDTKRRFSVEHKLVAQLSQNMNFIMDLSVEEFVNMHAESRMVENIAEVTRNIIAKANELAGEGFLPHTPVTALSGGQSRALMIADTAYLSKSPIVLIDEIENAGIDRQKALRLLVDKQKIVLMATHDPILALMGDKRLVIKNGGISQVIPTSEQERSNLAILEKMDRQLAAIRNVLRDGGRIDLSPAELGLVM